MQLNLNVQLTENETKITTTDEQPITLILTNTFNNLDKDTLQLVLNKKGTCQLVEDTLPEEVVKAITIQINEIELTIFRRWFANEFFKGSYAVPDHLQKSYQPLGQKISQILTAFGINLSAKPKKAPSAKAQHRWRKELAEIPFYVDDFGAKATIYWQKRNELRIEKGATLLADAPLNKDGSLGFGARFALTLRQEQADKIKENQTIDDIVLKSVNEVGHLLYFAGTNSWLVLKDENGKTIDAYSRVE